MHGSSLDEMKKFVDGYLDKSKPLRIIDIGSVDVSGGTYKSLFENENWEYLGLDLEPGPNVDIVSSDMYDWPVDDESFDIVISGQCIEHVEDTHKWICEVARIAKKGGTICVIGPWACPEHRYPIDCWRIFPDGMRFLIEKIAKLEPLDIYRNDHPAMDCVGIARKPE